MAKRKKWAVKSRILPMKVELANHIRANWECENQARHPFGDYYWSGIFIQPKTGKKVRIHFQRYVRNMSMIDYVDLHWLNDNRNIEKSLTVSEIKQLIENQYN